MNDQNNIEKTALIPDGSIERKIGNTTYVVNVFFNHNSEMTAEDRIKRVILDEIRQNSSENIHTQY